jgi:transcriptional regulator with XRE-family HTH domain
MKLEEYLKKKKLTQVAFGFLYGISSIHINRLIRGKSNPSINLAKHIEEVTNGAVTMQELFNPNAPARFKKPSDKSQSG